MKRKMLKRIWFKRICKKKSVAPENLQPFVLACTTIVFIFTDQLTPQKA